jgi:5-oxoprolinase (ATP-hydrolysing)
MEAALLSTRREFAPQGICGGHAAKLGCARLIRTSGAVETLPGCFSVSVQAGDAIEILTPGGGGYGAPPASAGPD